MSEIMEWVYIGPVGDKIETRHLVHYLINGSEDHFNNIVVVTRRHSPGEEMYRNELVAVKMLDENYQDYREELIEHFSKKYKK